MSSNYAGLNVQHAQITIPSDGDPAIAESVNTAFRDLMDNSVYAITEVSHKIDDRGGVFTLTGGITIQGTPNWNFDVDVAFTDDVTFGDSSLLNDDVVSIYNELRVRGDANLRGAVTIGSGGSQQMDVYSDATFFGNARFEDDVRLGIDAADNVVVDGSLEVNEPSSFTDDVSMTDLTVSGDTVLGSGSSSSITVNGQLNVTGSTTLGNASTDDTVINGSLTTTGDVTLGNASGDETTVTGRLDVVGDAVLGTNDANIVTIPAQLVVGGDMTLNGALGNALTYTGFGRVPGKSGLINASTTVNVASGNFLVMTTVGTVTISMSDTGATNGDYMFFIKSSASSGATLNVFLPDGSALISSPAGSPACALAVRAGGSWFGIVLAS
jgi:hypothetical protein